MPFPAAQTSFGAGELSPEVRARIDIAKYGAGASLLKNFFVRVQGGASTRAGHEFVVNVQDDDKVARLIEFSFNVEQTYMLIFQEFSMRVIKDGGIVLELAIAITGATQGNPVVVTAIAHGFSNGDEVFIQGVIGMIELNERFFVVANVTANTFELTGINGTGFNAYIGDGTVSRIFTLTTPYLDGEIFDLGFTQSNDVLTLTHPSHDPADVNRLADDNWTYDVIVIEPTIQAPTGVGVVYSGSGTGTVYDYVVTAFNEDTGEESIASTPANVPSGDLTNAGDSAAITWNTVTDATVYNIFKAEDGSGFFGFIGSADNLTFTDRNITPEFNDSPAISIRDPFAGVDDKPGSVEYFQGRRWFANTNNQPTTVFGSVSGNFSNFNVSKAVRDDDAVTATLSAKTANAIRFMVPLGQLIVFTSGSEWLLASSGQSALITPSTVSFANQSYWGVLPVKPLVIGNAAIYLSGNNEPDENNPKFSQVRDLAYRLESDNFGGNELSILSTHLFDDHEIVDWAYTQIPYSLVWCMRDDGIALTMAYLAEQNVFAWSQHETQGMFESVATIREGGEDATYFVIRRKIGGIFKRFVERQHTRRFTDVRDYFGVDSGLTYDPKLEIFGATQANPVTISQPDHGYQNGDRVDINDVVGMTELNDFRFKVINATAATYGLQTNEPFPTNIDGTGFEAYESGGLARLATETVVGLDHLEGETLVALADGNVLTDLIVTDGAIELGAFYSRVHTGLSYECDLETIDAVVQDKSGVVLNTVRKVDEVILRFSQSRGGSVGSSEDTLFPIKWRDDEEWGRPGALSDKDEPVDIESSWAYAAKVFFRQSDPLPTTILSVIPTLDRGDD